MFTGLIEEVGTIASVERSTTGHRVTVRAPRLAAHLKTGDSISVSGVCLTALDISGNTFQADLAAETVGRTSLSRLEEGRELNLELPTRAGTPMGGHVVQGHVDGTANLISLERVTGAADWVLKLHLPAGLERYVVEKGSIAVEGISLTVAAVRGREVTIAIIPHTYEATNLHALKAGDPLNIEVDVLAKYAERQRGSSQNISLDWLIQQGF